VRSVTVTVTVITVFQFLKAKSMARLLVGVSIKKIKYFFFLSNLKVVKAAALAPRLKIIITISSCTAQHEKT
jgi:hypothetical protein